MFFIVAFRSAKVRTFAERKATLVLGWIDQVISRVSTLKQFEEVILNVRRLFSFGFVFCVIPLLSATCVFAQHGDKSAAIPDFLKGDRVPEGHDHQWNLGPTGAQGWMYTSGHETTEARQILITKVDKDAPADGVLEKDDVILGVGGSRFSYDPRTEFGKAITAAEASNGELAVEVFRKGETSTKTIQLEVLQGYSATAPFDCPKSQRIFHSGCDSLAKQMEDNPNSGNGIVRSLNTLALLSSGREEFMPIIKRQVKWAASYSDVEGKSLCCWFYGPINLLLAEYTLATGDKTYLPDLRRISLEICDGQSLVGSWGHRFAKHEGRLGGYGMMNAPGLPMMLSLVLAKKAGVDDQALDEAIQRSSRLVRFYVGKGCVPYGDHAPWIETHDDNGKNGIAALLFNALEEKEAAEYFSRMSVCSYGGERDLGHTGNFMNVLWGMPAVALSGPHASGAWMQEYGWYYDLARRFDGTFLHQGEAQAKNDRFHNWNSSGALLLAYAQPLRKLYVTGKTSVAPQVTVETAASLIEDGRGYSRRHKKETYADRTEEQLLTALASWSPVVRQRAANQLGKRKGNFDSQLEELMQGDLYSKLGACQALAKMGARAKPAVPTLQSFLKDDDLWLRINAAQALASSGPSGRVAIPELLEMLAEQPTEDDPRGMLQRYLCSVLFDRRSGMLKQSLADIDREKLYRAVRAGLENEDGRARSMFATVYNNLSYEEIKPLLPAIHRAIVEPAPSGIMFADGIRLSGLQLLAKHRIKEGIPLCSELIGVGRWGLAKRIPKCLDALEVYAGAAKSEVAELEALYKELASKPKKSEKNLKLLERIERLIDTINSDKSKPALRSLPKNEA